VLGWTATIAPSFAQTCANNESMSLRRSAASGSASLRRSRATLFHYPTLHLEKDKAGTEDLANAMREARNLDGWIEGGDDYASFWAVFADEVALQFLADSEEATSEVARELEGPVFELVEFAEAALLAQLKRVSPNKTTIWRKGHTKPNLA
jgi:hypothetical protein